MADIELNDRRDRGDRPDGVEGEPVAGVALEAERVGVGRGVFWRDMGVVNQRGGRPIMALTGGALSRLEELTPAGMSPQIDLTLTDEYPMAQAIVIISAVPRS